MTTQQHCKIDHPHAAHNWSEAFERDDMASKVFIEHFLCTGVMFDAKTAEPPKPANKRAAILSGAEKLINGDRADTYGSSEQSFGRIANLWNAMGMQMHDPVTGPRPVTAVDVTLALTQLKVSRIMGQINHEDSWMDAAGYIALGAELALKESGN